MLKIKHPITGDLIQVAENDFENREGYHDAERVCRELGNGWRLPTISELELIFEELYLKEKGGFKSKEYYWSITQNRETEAWALLFTSIGPCKLTDTFNIFYVRAVRTI